LDIIDLTRSLPPPPTKKESYICLKRRKGYSYLSVKNVAIPQKEKPRVIGKWFPPRVINVVEGSR